MSKCQAHCPWRRSSVSATVRAIKVALTRPEREHGHVVFTRLTVTYTHRRPRLMGHRRSLTLKLRWGNGAFGWSA
jgi:hypothetical protein